LRCPPRLTAKIEDIWHATTTTNEDRKLLLATAISKVILHDSSEDMFDVEIIWASGRSERHQAFKTRGGTKLIVELRNAGEPVSEILKAVTAMGLTTQRGLFFTRKALQHKLWLLGFNKKGPRLEALRLVRSMLMEKRSRQEILEALQTKGPKPYEGEWTQQRVTSAIRSIDSGAWAPKIPLLPDSIPRARRLAPEAIDVLINGRNARRTFGEIVEELNTLGLRTPRGRPFNYLNAYQLYDHLQKDPSLADRFGDKSPRKSSQGVGSQPRQLGSRGRKTDQASQREEGQ
jgi:hypothetical protein